MTEQLKSASLVPPPENPNFRVLSVGVDGLSSVAMQGLIEAVREGAGELPGETAIVTHHDPASETQLAAVAIEAMHIGADCFLIDRPTAPSSVCPLSARHLGIVRLAAEGQTNAEIAKNLGIALTSVQYGLKRVGLLLGTRGRQMAIAECYRRGWFPPDQETKS